MRKVELHEGDCLETLRTLPDNSVDSVCTDPPYHLTSIVKRFGGAKAAPAKVGQTGAFARASRGFMGQTWDGGDIAFRPELWAEVLRVLKPGGHLAAFSGTRTYHRMAVAIEDAGFEIRDQLAWTYGSGFVKSHNVALAIDKAAGATGHLAKSFNVKGGGSRTEEFASNGRDFSIRHEPITSEAQRWAGWGTALKPAWEPICLARKALDGTISSNVLTHGSGAINVDACRISGEQADRWPANILHDGEAGFGEQGRFFYCAKASKADREDGNNHPTVKPTDLMRWLCRLITPPGGVVLDPFTGSGSTGKAAVLEGFGFIGMELSAEYAAIARRRITSAGGVFAAPTVSVMTTDKVELEGIFG